MPRHTLTAEDRRKAGLKSASKPGHMQRIAKLSSGGKVVVGKYGAEHMKQIGARGGKRLHELYKMTPAGQSGWALARRDTGFPVYTIGSVPKVLKEHIERMRLERHDWE